MRPPLISEIALTKPQTSFEKIWAAHVIEQLEDGSDLLWIDRHLVNEGTSAQAFIELEERGLPVARPTMNLSVADHFPPTRGRHDPLKPGWGRDLIFGLRDASQRAGVPHIDYLANDQGICHVIGPELGFVLPGMIAVCGDSHTSTLGALGAIAFGIGTSELTHVLATGTLVSRMPKSMAVELSGQLAAGVTAKDLILAIIGEIGTAGGTGHAIEYRGEAVGALEIEGRLTLCNMTIEAGARSGLVAPDEKTYAYLRGRPMAPEGAEWDRAQAWWRSLPSDPDARFDRTIHIDAGGIAPQVTWGTSPQDVAPVDGKIPDPASFADPKRREAATRALAYQGLMPGMKMSDIRIDQVFVGSCTNSRLSDLQDAARLIRGRKLAEGVTGFISPGSTRVKQRAEAEGLDVLFREAGFEWRDSACSMCCGIDTAPPGTRVAATSNRNFENRQGREVRTHLVGPAMAVAAGLAGHFVDIRKELADA
jgi:3-isopropylmalate/(R)-2-methylmalate dehydratase large subunit